MLRPHFIASLAAALLIAPAALAQAPAQAPAKAPARAPRAVRTPMPPQPSPAPDALGKKSWYGWQILLAGTGADAIAVLGVGTQSTAVSWLGISAAALTGPVVHNAHGEVGRGFLSLGLNALSGTVGAIVGTNAAAGCERLPNRLEPADPNCWPALPTVRGIFVGLQVAMLVDAFALAWAPERPEKWAAPRPRLEVSPTFAVLPGGSSFGLVGRF